jgi:hypothetical protein
MHFSLAEGNAYAKQRPVFLRVDTDRNEYGARNHRSAVPHLLVASIQHQVRGLAQRALPPGRQFLVEEPGRAAHLRTRYLQPAELLHDFGHLARFRFPLLGEGLRMVPSLAAGAGAGVPPFPGTWKNGVLAERWPDNLRRFALRGMVPSPTQRDHVFSASKRGQREVGAGGGT